MISVWLLICIGVLVQVQIDSRILVLASTGQGNLQKNLPVRRHSAQTHSKPSTEQVYSEFVRASGSRIIALHGIIYYKATSPAAAEAEHASTQHKQLET
jgi:hypothetical protein